MIIVTLNGTLKNDVFHLIFHLIAFYFFKFLVGVRNNVWYNIRGGTKCLVLLKELFMKMEVIILL